MGASQGPWQQLLVGRAAARRLVRGNFEDMTEKA